MEITTDRLRLRALDSADAAALVTYLNDWEVARWLARPPYPYSPQDAAAFILFMQQRHEADHPLLFALAELGSGRLIGTIGIEPGGAGGGELGYWVGRPHWGQGYGREAARAAIAHAAAAGLAGLTAFAHPENARSARLLEGCGFRADGTELRDGRHGPMPMRRFLLRPL
jgi:RimJ/RimL family protein N-acetyltransferase